MKIIEKTPTKTDFSQKKLNLVIISIITSIHNKIFIFQLKALICVIIYSKKPKF